MACGSNSLGEPNLPEESGATYTMISGFDFAPTSRFAFGPATLDVATVEIELGDGSTVQARIFTAPKALGAPLRFYLAELSANASPTKIIGKDSTGQVLGTIKVLGSLSPEH